MSAVYHTITTQSGWKVRSSQPSSCLDLEEVIEKTDALYISFEQHNVTLQQLYELQQKMKKMD